MTHHQDELRALQRLSSSCFLVGYLGFTTTWLLDLLARATGRPALATAALRTRAALRALSPHYVLAQGVYDVAGTYQGQGAYDVTGLCQSGSRCCVWMRQLMGVMGYSNRFD